MTSKRFVSWAAVSSLPQAKKVSLDDQLRTNREHAARHGGTIVEELVVPGESRNIVLFEDAARKMAAYARLRELVAAKAFDVLIYLDRSRLGRKSPLSMAVIGICQEAGIATYETDNPPSSLDDLRNSYDSAIIGAFKSVSAEQEIVKFQARRDSGMDGRIRSGKMAATANYGYRIRYKQAEQGTALETHYEVHEAEAATVRLIFALYLEGNGAPAIAAELTARGIPPPRGESWTHHKPRTIIDNAHRYAGYVEYNRRSQRGREYVRARGDWTPIIDDATLQRVLAEREARRYNRRLPNTAYRLSGVVWCAVCGNPMYIQRQVAHDGSEYMLLRCARHKPSASLNHGVALIYLREAIASLARADVEDLLGDYDDNTAELTAAITAQERIITQATNRRRTADDAYVDGDMDADGYRRQVARLKATIAEATAEIERLRHELTSRDRRDQRRQRIGDVIAEGLLRLDDPDPTAANVWLRAHIRLWAGHKAAQSIELL